MKKLLHISLLLLPLVTFWQCLNPIEFDDDDIPASKLVLQSLITPGDNVTVSLTATRFFLDESDTFRKINNAVVLLYKDAVFIDSLQCSGDGVYISAYQPQSGDKLKITASAPNFQTVESEITVVTQPDFVSADTLNVLCGAMLRFYHYNEPPYNTVIDTVRHRFNGDITLHFNDSPDRDDYYYIVVYIKTVYYDDTYEKQMLFYESKNMVFSSNSVSLGMLGGEEMEKDYTIFTDELFAGKNYAITININAENNSQNQFFYPKTKVDAQYLAIELHSVSKDYYLFQKSAMAAGNDEMGGTFSEPVQVYSNVKNGIGVVGSYNVARKEFNLKNASTEIYNLESPY